MILGAGMLCCLQLVSVWAQGETNKEAITAGTRISLDVAVLVGSGIVTVLVALAAVKFHVNNASIHYTREHLNLCFVERAEFLIAIQAIKDSVGHLEQTIPDKVRLSIFDAREHDAANRAREAETKKGQ